MDSPYHSEAKPLWVQMDKDNPPALATPAWAAPAWEVPILIWKAGRVTVSQEHKGGEKLKHNCS